MNSENEIIIAFVFNRSGKKEMTNSEFYLSVSMDLNWFTPDDAKNLLKQMVESKLLKEKGEKISPNFDINKISVPTGFYPSKTVFEEEIEIKTEKEPDVLEQIIKKITRETKKKKETLMKDIEKISHEKNISLEVGALLIAKEYDIDMKEFYSDAEDSLS